MTKKRFILVEYVNKGLFIQDNANDETQYFQGSKASLEKVVNLLNNLNDENEQLRQRNTNQYNQLTELWEIIEEENWEKLIAMKKQLKEDEERLQKEWGCYE